MFGTLSILNGKDSELLKSGWFSTPQVASFLPAGTEVMMAAEVLPDEVTFNAAISACEKAQVRSTMRRMTSMGCGSANGWTPDVCGERNSN